MNNRDFHDRVEELSHLNKEFESKQANLIVLYGRRRVGKTALIKAFMKNKPSLYFLADKQLEIEQQTRFKLEMARFLHQPELADIDFKDWDALFQYLIVHFPQKKKCVLVLDEFQYLAKINPAFPSILQRIWDEQLGKHPLTLILSGSLINMMYATALSYESPLYGRRTSQMKLSPIPFKFSPLFYPKLPFQKLVEFYAVVGGVPKYMEAFPAHGSIDENIAENILDKNQYLYQEPRFILEEELNETTTYFSLLHTIAQGNHKIGDIANTLKMPPNALTRYLDVLLDLDILMREVPITEKHPDRSKRGRYTIKDHFFHFWFRFILPNQPLLEIGNRTAVSKIIRQSFSSYVGKIYERICQEILFTLKLPFIPEKVGRWWGKDGEIDLVAYHNESREILFGECKWTEQPVDLNTLGELKEKSKLVDWHLGKRKEYFILFSKSGFTLRLKKLSKREKNLLLVSGNKLTS